jgi:hypothetical protein
MLMAINLSPYSLLSDMGDVPARFGAFLCLTTVNT